MNGPQTLSNSARKPRYVPALPVVEDDLPLLYEDDEAEELGMGEANYHLDNNMIFLIGTRDHFAKRRHIRVYSNLNLYYTTKDRRAYVSPDGMVVEPLVLEDDVRSYRIGEDGPSPLLTAEMLSARTGQQGDLKEKLTVYAKLGIPEYLLIDTQLLFMDEQLLMKRLQPDRTWKDEQDPDGGVTSNLGFRVIIDTDGRLRVVNARTGIPYLRPDEARTEAIARHAAEKARQKSERLQQRAQHREKEAEKLRLKAEQLRREERQRRLEAETAKQQAEEAKRLSDERVRELEAELARLRAAQERP